ncbi:hypothetical protein [Cellulomonas sp. Root485]|uniref:hypothetical protein n=1 Tax=Cellulomonas sp. Root485 TaxID=1736546 RepID=UPI00138EF1B4|nr:hypothetical protein [Cellulomonas sp. Root485]
MLQKWLPEATPRRFGSFEPMQSTLDGDGVDGFLDELAAGGNIYWSATKPFFGGELWRGDAIEDLLREMPGGVPSAPEGPRVDRLVLDLDSRVLRDPRWHRDIVDGFAAIADALSAFYGRAWIDPGWVVAANGRVWADAQTRGGGRGSVIHWRESHWLGLRPDPLWLAWFGTRFGSAGVGETRGSGRLFIASGEPSESGAPAQERPPVAGEWLASGAARAAVVPSGL